MPVFEIFYEQLMNVNQNVSPIHTASSAMDLRQSMNLRQRHTNQDTKVNNLTLNEGQGQTLPHLKDRLKEDNMQSRHNKPKSAHPSKRRVRNQLSPNPSGIDSSAFIQNKPNFQATTLQNQQRVNNIGVHENAINLSFETRIKEIYNAKDASIKLNPKVIETWINETLLDAEHLDIPGVVLKPEHKNPICRYGIDRLSLTNAGIPNDLVDRIYRGLFVYSIGFYEMLQKCLHHADNKYSLLTCLWKVFAILLEYCCKSNYQMLISKISREHKDELEKIESHFIEQISKLSENEKNLKENLESLQLKKDELQKQKEEETFLRKKIEEEFNQNIQNHEQEVQLRLKFESKLNNMHALHRDLQAKYQRALEDIYQLENQNHMFSKLVSDQKTELIELRSEKVENESKITYQGERIKQLIQENELKLRQLNDSELKLSKVNAENEQKNLSLKNSEKQLNEMRLKIDANRTLIDGLTSEKNHLDLSLKENKDQKEQFKEKCDRLQKLHEGVFQEMQEYKKQLVGIQEIKKDRDDRIEKLRDEFEEISQKYDILEREHTSLKVHHEHVTDEYASLKMDFESVSEKLKISNKVRNEKEEQLNDKINQTHTLNDTIKDRDYQIEKQRKELDKLTKRLHEVERQNDSLEIKKKSLDKQSEIQRKQLLDKIQNLNELVSAEKDTREMWINRYEKEQKQHIITNTDLLTTKGQLQDAQLKIKNLDIIIESIQKSRDQTKDSNQDLQNTLTSFISTNEQLERDLYTKTELLRAVEEQHKMFVAKLKNDLQKMEDDKYFQIYCKDIEYEDLRSYSRRLFESNDLLKIKNDEIQEQFNKLKEAKIKLDYDYQQLQEQYNDITNKYGSLSDSYRKEQEKAGELDFQCQQYNRQLDQMQEELQEYERKAEEFKQIQSENMVLIEKIKLLEDTIDNSKGAHEIIAQKKAGNFLNRGIQTKKIKQKERNIQTDVLQTSYIQQQQVLFSTTQASTNKNSVASQRRPRIASAANTATTMGFSGHNLVRDPSQGMTSTIVNSQHDLGFMHDVGIGSGSNISDYDRVIKSAAQKYRHLIPNHEAIQEEAAENVTRTGLFKRNSHLEDDENDRVYLKKQTADYIYESNGGNGSTKALFNRQESLQARIMSGSSQPTALAKHQLASRQMTKGTSDDNYQGFMKRQPSTHSSKRSGEIKDEMTQEVLKSVYEKRIQSSQAKKVGFGTLQRPITQPGQNRTSSVLNQGVTGLSGFDNIDTIFTPSDSSQMNKFRFENQQYQQTLNQHTGGRTASVKSGDRSTKGKPSIKNLIKVATSREN